MVRTVLLNAVHKWSTLIIDSRNDANRTAGKVRLGEMTTALKGESGDHNSLRLQYSAKCVCVCSCHLVGSSTTGLIDKQINLVEIEV